MKINIITTSPAGTNFVLARAAAAWQLNNQLEATGRLLSSSLESLTTMAFHYTENQTEALNFLTAYCAAISLDCSLILAEETPNNQIGSDDTLLRLQHPHYLLVLDPAYEKWLSTPGFHSSQHDPESDPCWQVFKRHKLDSAWPHAETACPKCGAILTAFWNCPNGHQ